jgi:hypothetical protein
MRVAEPGSNFRDMIGWRPAETLAEANQLAQKDQRARPKDSGSACARSVRRACDGEKIGDPDPLTDISRM